MADDYRDQSEADRNRQLIAGGGRRGYNDDESAMKQGVDVAAGGYGSQDFDTGDRRGAYGPGGSGSPALGGNPHDAAYRQWRDAQMKQHDDDYDAWHAEQRTKHHTDFDAFRKNRGSTVGGGMTPVSGSADTANERTDPGVVSTGAKNPDV